MIIRDNTFRLSRLTYPRATFRAMLLVALVFLGFGLVAQASISELVLHGSFDVLAGQVPFAAVVWLLLTFAG